MAGIPITTNQVVRVSLVFVLLILGFGILSSITGWPDKQGWGLAVILALVIAALPLLGPLLAFLRDSGAVVDIKGVKFDFSALAVRGASIERSNLDVNPGMPVSDSNAASIAQAAEQARSASVVVVDLGTGRSWYPSRFFALAAAAQELRGAQAIVIVAQQGALAGRFIGWVTPDNAVIAFRQCNEGYWAALLAARAIVRHLRLSGGNQAYTFPNEYADGSQFLAAYRATGDLAFVPALISRLQRPAVRPGTPMLENVNEPSWLSREEVERILDPWLIREKIRDDQSEVEKRAALVGTDRPFLAVTEGDGKYLGMINVTSSLCRAEAMLKSG